MRELFKSKKAFARDWINAEKQPNPSPPCGNAALSKSHPIEATLRASPQRSATADFFCGRTCSRTEIVFFSTSLMPAIPLRVPAKRNSVPARFALNLDFPPRKRFRGNDERCKKKRSRRLEKSAQERSSSRFRLSFRLLRYRPRSSRAAKRTSFAAALRSHRHASL